MFPSFSKRLLETTTAAEHTPHAMLSAAASESVAVSIHPSQFPRAVEAALRDSLRARRMQHKFHYDTPKQALRWLRLHEALSPARTDPEAGRLYDAAFAEGIAALGSARNVAVISLGCGGGQKEAQLLQLLSASRPEATLRYVPVDVSVALALTARAAALEAGLKAEAIRPLVADLGLAEDWKSALAGVLEEESRRVVCFFGMLPNFLPSFALASLAGFLRPSDLLIVSANLAPGPDYAAGVARVLPQYDNRLTREWLWSVLLDLGVERDAGEMSFRIAPCPEGSGLLRIESAVTFTRAVRIEFAGEVFDYEAGGRFELFFSYRHTPERLAALLAPHGVVVRSHGSNASGEEGVFVCARPVA